MEPSLIERDARDGVVTLRLNQPHKLNPLSLSMQQALLAQLLQIGADTTVRALILTARGKAFCAGGDLGEMQAAQRDGLNMTNWTRDCMTTITTPLLMALRELPVPVVCAINGVAAGSGVGLALAADIVLMARSAFLALPFAPRLGLLPDLGSTFWLPRLMGRSRAMGAALLDQRITATQAVQWGMAWDACEDDELPSRADAIAHQLAALPPGIVQKLREAFDHAERHDFASHLRFEADEHTPLMDSPAFAEGVRAFMEKRAPIFHPR